jgi:inosose dehydratase
MALLLMMRARGLTKETGRCHHTQYKRLAAMFRRSRLSIPAHEVRSMNSLSSRFKFASAPDSWGVLDYPGPSWEQSYQKMLDEMVMAGYTGTELGPYGFFPTDPAVLGGELAQRKLTLLGSFVPAELSDPASAQVVVDHVRKVGGLLAALGAPFLVLADAQSEERDQIAGRVPADGSKSWTAAEWKQVAKVVGEAAAVTSEFGLDLVFHPHVSTHVETAKETEQFYDATSASKIGLCLDTGHSLYAGDDPVAEAEKYADILRFVHLKDVDLSVLADARKNEMNFEQAIERNVFTVIGAGAIDFPGFLRTLDKNGYEGWMVVEQDVKFGATLRPPVESIAASLRYLNQVVQQLEPAGHR